MILSLSNVNRFLRLKEAVLLIMDSPGNLNLYNLLVIKLLRLIDGLACYLNAEFLEHVEID